MKLRASVRQYRTVADDLRRFQERHCVSGNVGARDVDRMLQFIHDHLFDQDLNVRLVKARCRLRDNNVSTRFRRSMGITVKRYIEQMRMEAAAELLRERSIGVLDVALAIGYEHPQTFYHAFRRCYACTPSTFRHRSADRERRS